MSVEVPGGLSVKTVPLTELRLDGGTQPRARIDQSVVDDYRAVLDALPPVIVFFDGAEYWLADGFHRVHAFLGAGKTGIPAEIRTGTQRDAVFWSVGANAAHGLRRSNEDKRRAVLVLLSDAEWSKLADRAIADACGVSHPFVASLRPKPAPQLEADSSSPAQRRATPTPERRQGRDGKVRALPAKSKAPTASAVKASPPRPVSNWDGWETGTLPAWRNHRGTEQRGEKPKPGCYFDLVLAGSPVRIEVSGRRRRVESIRVWTRRA